jgi:hypothetical protein
MSESEMPATGDGIPLLLENRIQVLRLAAEILRFLRRGTPVDPAFRDIVLSKKADSRAVLFAALLRGQILKAVALAGILTLACIAARLAIRVAFA